MKSALKFILISIGLILILTGVGAFFVLGQAQGLLTKSVEGVLTNAFGSLASVETIGLRPAKRALVLNNFQLANPEGFAEGNALKCERIEFKMRPGSLLRREPVIETMLIDGAEIRYLYKLGRGTNIGALAKGLASRSAADTPTFRVDRLTCTDAKVHLSANFMPNTGIGLNVVTVNLRNLENGDSITGAEITSIFLRSVLVETLTLKGLLKPAGKNIRSEVSELEPDTDQKEAA